MEFARAIREEDAVAGLDVFSEAGISGGSALGGTEHLLGGDSEFRALSQRAAAVFETAEADLGTLQVEENTGVHAVLASSGANRGDARGVIVNGAVRGVEAE